MRLLLASIFFACCTQSFAAQSIRFDGEYCFDDAAEKMGLDRDLLLAIAMTESRFKKNAINVNSDGTEDVGVMQINSTHLTFLNSVGISRRDLFNACVNIHVGAFILKDCIRRHGKTWNAVGAYNAGSRKTPRAIANRKIYVAKVFKNYQKIKQMKAV